jgi:hypothetical protein
MKTTILSILLAVFLLNAYAQENEKKEKGEKKINVPELVKKAFAAKYPKATKVKWSLEKEGEYEAEFNINKAEMSAVFDEKGTCLEVETEIKQSELPQGIKTALAKDFAGYKIEEVEKAEGNGIITYEMEAKKDKAKFELIFDNTGKLIKKEEKKAGKEKDRD